MRKTLTIKDVVDSSRPTFPKRMLGQQLPGVLKELPIAFDEDTPEAVVVVPFPLRTYDFVGRTYANDGASVAEADAINGTVRTFTDDFTGENLGARSDPAYANLAAGISFADGTPGVIGSGGVLPSKIAFNAGATFGQTVEVVSCSATAVRLKLSGTPTSNGNMYVVIGGLNDIVVAANTLYTMSFAVRLFELSLGVGSPPSIVKMTRELTAAGAFVANRFPEGNYVRIPGDAAKAAIPVTNQRTMSATTGRIQPGFGLAGVATSMTNLTFEFEISLLNVTLGEGRMPYGTSAVAADDLTLKSLTLPAENSGHVRFRLPPDTVLNGTILQLGDATNHVKFRQTDYRIYASIVTGGGAAVETPIGYALPWAQSEIAYAIVGGTLRASLNGKPAVSCGAVPALSGARLGGGVSGPLRGAIQSFGYYESALSDIQLIGLSKLGSSILYDDFDRADMEVVTPWSGQNYQVTGTSLDTGIVSKRMVTADSGGATTSAYFTVPMPSQPKLFGGMVSFENAAGAASCGLIITPNNTVSAASGITAKSLHFLFAAGGLFAGTYDANVLVDRSFAFRTTLTKDDATLHTVVWKMRADGSLAVRVPGGEVIVFRDVDFGLYGGLYAVPESYWSVVNPGRPKWAALQAEAA